MYLRYFLIISSWKRAGPSFEQTWISFTYGSLVEIVPVVLEKKIFKYLHYNFFYFAIISPWRRAWPFIWKIFIPLYPKILVRSLVEIDPVVLEKKMNMWKVYDNDDAKANDDGQILIRKANLSLRLDDLKIFYIFCWCTVKTLTPQFISTEK